MTPSQAAVHVITHVLDRGALPEDAGEHIELIRQLKADGVIDDGREPGKVRLGRAYFRVGMGKMGRERAQIVAMSWKLQGDTGNSEEAKRIKELLRQNGIPVTHYLSLRRVDDDTLEVCTMSGTVTIKNLSTAERAAVNASYTQGKNRTGHKLPGGLSTSGGNVSGPSGRGRWGR